MQEALSIGQKIQSDLAEFASPKTAPIQEVANETLPLDPHESLLADYDRRISDEDLRLATRTRFVSKHFADAVESAVKALCECVRARTGRSEDGDELMTNVFSPKNPLLRVNRLSSKSDESEQRGHMMLCQGVVAAWRNPRAHALLDDDPQRALLMVEAIQDLMRVTKAATRTRKKRSP